jgi:hypothetical protein
MRVPVAIVCLVTAGAFLFLHTGARASALCERDGAAVSDGLSAWPPGTRCSGGLPVVTRVKFDETVLFVIPAIALLAFGGAALAQRSRVRV